MNYRQIATSPIRFWTRFISPLSGPRCRYEPSCSRYATQAIEELGILRGTVLAGWRILRCNPWSHGGVDTVADRTLFRKAHKSNCGSFKKVHNS
jgi:putative membrane protein insertion efficiency factor